ncbi:hypothetical protein T265_07883 [Opisthorchis viverrini]|uniref:Uncharacterized protein n=1 Tax=Opisthorchis viverrini TaxID=6198 RepID=A0A074ZFP0_OPIVI|nr:hypothetical protein T265_07883 [Opisthorchis viverrini]KER24457.1 hypothetical protein T265_07883 [Opisthorchis viverrini]
MVLHGHQWFASDVSKSGIKRVIVKISRRRPSPTCEVSKGLRTRLLEKQMSNFIGCINRAQVANS